MNTTQAMIILTMTLAAGELALAIIALVALKMQGEVIKMLRATLLRGIPIRLLNNTKEKEADNLDNLQIIVTKIVQTETSKHNKCLFCQDNNKTVGELLIHLETDHGYIVDEKLKKEIDEWLQRAIKMPKKK